jgi:hypothetical protein
MQITDHRYPLLMIIKNTQLRNCQTYWKTARAELTLFLKKLLNFIKLQVSNRFIFWRELNADTVSNGFIDLNKIGNKLMKNNY